MGVYLGRGKVRVPQQHLNRTQICTMIKQMCCKGMTERVGRQVLTNTCSGGVVANPVPESLARHGRSAISRKKRISGPPLQKLRATFFHIQDKPIYRLLTQRNQALFVALSGHTYDPLPQVYLIHPQAGEFRYSQTTAIQYLQHGLITLLNGQTRIWLSQKRVHFIFCQRVRQATRQTGAVDAQGGVFRDQPLAKKKAVKPTNTREATSSGRRF